MILSEAIKAIENSKRKYYVYILRKPRTMKDKWTSEYPDGTPSYVGAGEGRRLATHENMAAAPKGPAFPLTSKVNSHLMRTIDKIWRKGGQPRYQLEFYRTREAVLDRERKLIKRIGRRHLKTGPLTNLREGGDGLVDPSQEVRRRIGRATKKRLSDPENLRRLSQERRQYFSDPKNRAKQSLAIRKAYQENPSLLQENRESQKVAQSRLEVAAKKSAAMKNHWGDPAWAAKERRKQSEGWTAEKKRKKSKRIKQWYADHPEEYRAKIKKLTKTMRKPGNRKKNRERMIAQRARMGAEMDRRSAEARRTPEHRKMRGAITRKLLSNPAIKKRQRAGQRRAIEYRTAIRDDCISLIKQHGLRLQLPHHASAIKTWEAFKTKLTGLTGSSESSRSR